MHFLYSFDFWASTLDFWALMISLSEVVVCSLVAAEVVRSEVASCSLLVAEAVRSEVASCSLLETELSALAPKIIKKNLQR